MKVVRYGPLGAEKPGLVDEQGLLRDLSGQLTDIDAQWLADGGMQALGQQDLSQLPEVQGSPRLGVPWAGIGKIICVGLNYADHAKESGLPVPTEPVLFTKAISAINGPNDPVMLPRDSQKTDWEVELGVVIGRTARYVSREQALTHVAGYCIVNDVSERSFQLERGGTWDKGKGCDTFAPIGPWLVSPEAISDVRDLDMRLSVNGELRQVGNTRTMVFGIDQIVSYISEFMTLHPGDLICSGTPPGVGAGMSPPQFLKAGDRMSLSISGLGEQSQPVIAWQP
ncbi:fumarylacetoacetate hydrolase family protein [Pseudomonas sp. GD03817]|uniref:2-hydroxyhepta-2,4-diene-1,7-dioate isomerase n=1 Tax=Pseudomonas putida TaxID=303 RepID=A0A1L5PSY7_PSEPU|nr:MULTISPECIES: fumarylacetoacetate hydrolase family protein [Pseudomonas]APO83213.1 2-hydroxyhepta-2,4-diene-1,7-dioate isomerase [Pseudomonas putida]MBA6136198.1 fumarylacetoacetate hydrolase family protein [Pseudomonas monteilii]MBF8806352.1 fumarylacetoacetate hydrolase family protein [Pseudomonas asiatica]MCE0989524.1 fumarylacetoacetate hydrolase family protein [Pseudomonas alloputida]MCE1060676.1 fumarylacetoacetate hydrolase family protein [Pseudomonas alloputida]